MKNTEWRDEAACAEPRLGMEMAWVDEDHELKDVAEKICTDCPVRKLCLQDAVDDTLSQGLRAGYWFDRGRLWKKDRERLLKEDHIRIYRGRAREYNNKNRKKTTSGSDEEMSELRRG